MLTDNARYFFTPAAQADYRAGLSPLGAPTGFEQQGRTRLRGGFENRVYKVTLPDRVLAISSYREPGPAGKLEQFLVAPAQ